MKTGFLLFILFLLGILTVPLVVSGCGLVETRDDIFISADGATITVILGICEKK